MITLLQTAIQNVSQIYRTYLKQRLIQHVQELKEMLERSLRHLDIYHKYILDVKQNLLGYQTNASHPDITLMLPRYQIHVKYMQICYVLDISNPASEASWISNKYSLWITKRYDPQISNRCQYLDIKQLLSRYQKDIKFLKGISSKYVKSKPLLVRGLAQ